jgi:small GTP-binding protein
MSLEEEIKAIEEEISKTKYNKATEHHIGRLKAKLARLRDAAQIRASAGGGGEGFSIKKSGNATVVMVGFPSAGKSTLLNSLTGTDSHVADYEFTTLDVIPGAMEYKGAKIQILDIPGIVQGAAAGRGRGKEVLSVIRSADLAMILLDGSQPNHYDIILKELNDAGIRINSAPPDITIQKKTKGGIRVNTTVPLSLEKNTIRSILADYRIHNADIVIREDITLDQLIDVIHDNRKYMPAIVVINKIDLIDDAEMRRLKEKFPEAILISADKKLHIEELKEKLFQKLGFIRIYLKPQGKPPDLEQPLIVRNGSTIGDICDRLHGDFRKRFRYAQVWGTSAKYEGQRAGLEHVLHDRDILTIILRKI